jgi:membrane protein involved in colicin uptake
MGKLGGTNTKKDAGMAKKDGVEQKKKDAVDRDRAKAEAEEWSQGANAKRTKAEEEKAQKADEVARKRREKEELLAAEEAEIGGSAGGTSQAKKLVVAAKKKLAGKPKSDLAALEDALQSSADKAAKKKKADLAAKKKREEEAIAAKTAESARQQAARDPLLVNTESMLSGSEDVGRVANQARMEATESSGIDAALGHLNVSGSGGTVISSAKALYNAFEARMMPIVKDEHPGLRLSQYKEKIFALWKKSPENPANHPDAKKY